jgi:hypothetical protein
MRIRLHLKNHCIEKAAKIEHERLVRQCLAGGGSDRRRLKLRLQGLQYFLENADFGCLRAEYNELIGNEEIEIELHIPDDYQDVTIRLREQTIIPKWKKN